jgi:CBS domain containing-hemolysin-like protein
VNLYAIGALVLLPLSVVLDEAVMWFGRNALDIHRSDEDDPAAEDLAQSAQRAHLLSCFLVAISFAGLMALATRSESAYPPVMVMVLAMAWSLLAGALSGVHWRSPLSLAGRALFRPLRLLGAVLRWLLVTGGRFRGLENPAPALDRVKEVEQETRWLLGRAGDEEQRAMLANLRDFGESLVEDVMVPREEIAGVPAEAGIDEILELVEREGHSRYPVYSDSLDTVIGVLHVFDLLQAPPDATAASLAGQTHFTNETKSVGTLLRELQVTYNQMAVVVDEYGGTAGIVTVEDLLEELVGEIEDEHDEEETPVRRLEPGVYWVEGTMRVDEVNEVLELGLEEGEYDTLAGLVLDRLERIPRPGERIRENGVWLEVLSSEPHRIQALKVMILDRGESEEGRSHGEDR